jgi:hypothetical protein
MNESIIGLICGGLGIIAFFIAGAAALFFGIRNRRKGAESNNWPSAAGSIARTWVGESTSTDEDGFSSTSYTPQVEYQYQVGSNTYTSKKISFGAIRSYGTQRRAMKDLEAYPVNAHVQVFYNPQKPDEAVLVRGTKGTLLGIILGIFFMLIAICIACGGLYFLITNA